MGRCQDDVWTYCRKYLIVGQKIRTKEMDSLRVVWQNAMSNLTWRLEE